MAASPYFAKLALPLFLEKFTTAAGPSMVSMNLLREYPWLTRQADLMLSMAECFPTYGAAAVRERGTELWEGIKTEVSQATLWHDLADYQILYSSDGAVEAAALKACESLARTMYPTAGDSPVGLAQDMIKESLEALSEPEKAQSLGATKILVALIRSSRECLTKVSRQLLG
jgi:DNA repair/transcription protein MET18/MMS19